MHTITARALSASFAGLVLVAGLTAVATADDDGTDPAAPCARQEAHVAKAEDALARVTAVFERKKQATDEAGEELADATGSERAAARKQLAKAKAAEAKAKKAKKAQQQRLAKAEQRLANCQAGQESTDEPTDEPTDGTTEPTEEPSESPTV
jgi:septal ring factor EnvC (AmiA/AmiB activator)